MLQIWRNRRTGDSHQDEFLARYDQILKWAQQLSANRPWQAEDLAQDAYLQFMAIRPNLDQIQNLDAYLYAIVRNLHRSLLHRHQRLRQVSLSILDFDCAEDGLKLVDKEHLQDICTDLELIRRFACERKETSKIGSLLILRFFFGYSVEETALLMGINRAALDARLLRARKEAREYLAGRKGRIAGKVVVLTEAPVPAEAAKQHAPMEFGAVDAIDVFRGRIFESAKGECTPRAQIKALYAPAQSSGIEHRLLAHIVSCRACLEAAAACVGAPSVDQRPPDDPQFGGPATQPREERRSMRLRRARKWDRQFKRLLEHRPQELRVTVNGLPLVAQPVVAGRGEVTISVPLSERIEFVEVLSEQEVRLLMLPVFAAPPEGEYEQNGLLEFGDGRALSIRLTFDDPWPTVHVQYLEPQAENAPEKAAFEGPLFGQYSKQPREITKGEALHRLLEWIWDPSSWLNVRFLTGATAIAMIAVLLLVQTRETTASAAELVSRMEDWQKHAAQPGAVLHRTFEFIERDRRSSQTNRRRVEVWRKSGAEAKISRLFDASGKMLASTRVGPRLPVLSQSNAWQFEPAADTYRALAGDLGAVRVKSEDQEIELISSSVTLTLDKKSYSPHEEILETPEATFEFHERSSVSEPESLSPFLPEAPARRASLRTPELPAVAPPVPAPLISDVDLDSSEVAARLVLHRLNADLGEGIHIRRREQEIEIAGILDSAQRKREIETALQDLPHVRPSLVSPEDLAASGDANARILSAVQSPPVQTSGISPPLLARFLEGRYPNETTRREYVDRIRDLARECLGRAYALKELADRYGTLTASPVSSIVHDHLASLETNWTEMSNLATPAVGADPGGQNTNETPDVRRNTAKLLKDLNALNRSLLRLFAEHSSLRESDGLDAELQNYWRLRHDAATSLAALSAK